MGEQLGADGGKQERSPGQRLWGVYERLSPEMEHGKHAKAHIDGWELRIASADDGTLCVSMSRRNDEGLLDLRMFEHNDWDPNQPYNWTPISISITRENAPERLAEMTDLAERAEWKTTLSDL